MRVPGRDGERGGSKQAAIEAQGEASCGILRLDPAMQCVVAHPVSPTICVCVCEPKQGIFEVKLLLQVCLHSIAPLVALGI